jgi:lipopolysaccharide/colanic/teichoic acid biosynthesis glycosyltransferase
MYLFLKRVFDLLFSSLLIILLSPALIAISLALFFFNKQEIIYLQKRVGFENKIFNIIKFSSMLKNSENLPGGTITLRNDTRVTTIGKILRITKLNELPQLFNVLIGEMSFVGPRPMVKKGFELYTLDVQSFIYQSKPGITGISSIVFRDEERWVTESKLDPEDFYKTHIFPYKGQLEKWYYENKSFLADMLILFLTGVKIIVPGSNLEFKIFRSLPTNDYFRKNQ